MATETVQMKVSGLMCSFCTMSVEKALKRYEGVQSVTVNLVHGVVLVAADTGKIGHDEIAEAGPLAEVEYRVPTMVCEGCAEKISEALRAVPGVREVKPKVGRKHVLVRYEPQKTKESQLKQALDHAGFAAVEA